MNIFNWNLLSNARYRIKHGFSLTRAILKQSPTHAWRSFVRWIEKTENTTLNYSRPIESKIALRRFERIFYPKNKNKRVSEADKLLMPIIAAACAVTLLEIVVGTSNEFFIFLNYIFLAVFIVEFLIRFNYKGKEYFRVWGRLDALVILSDIVTMIIYALSTLVDMPVVDQLVLARLLRFLRFARLIKLVVLVAKNTDYWLPILEHGFAVFKAMFIALLWISGFLVILILVSNFVVGANSEAIPNYISEILKSKFSLEEHPDNVELGQVLTRVTQGTSLIITLVITLFIGQTLFPIIERIQRERASLRSTKSLKSHVIVVIYNGDSLGVLEELVHVIHKYREKDLIVIYSSIIDENDLPSIDSSIKVIVGDLYNPSVWNSANASSAELLIVVGASEEFSNDLSVLAAYPDEVIYEKPKIVLMGDYDAYERKDVDGWLSGEIILIPLGKLTSTIAETVWLPSSLQFNFLRLLVDQFDEKIQFPSLSISQVTEQERQNNRELPRQLQKLNVSIEQVKNNVLLTFDETAAPKDEVSLIASINKLHRELGERFSDFNYFVYVKTLGLMNLNNVFQQNGIHNVIVFPVELAAVLAIFHEIYTPGIMEAWLLQNEEQSLDKRLALVKSPFPSKSFYTREELHRVLLIQDISANIVGVIGKSTEFLPIENVRLYSDNDIHNREIKTTDEIVFLK